MKSFKILGLLCFFAVILFVGCAEEDEDPIKIIINCTDTSSDIPDFSGYYIEDGDLSVFESDDYTSSTDTDKIYEKKVRNFDYLYIQAVKDSEDAILSIKLFKDDKLVKETSSGSGSSQVLTLEYEYEDDDDSSDSSDSSDTSSE